MRSLTTAPSKLVGTCNQCGLCCFDEYGNQCVYLELNNIPGRPQASRCTVHERRTPGMPILLMRDGKVAALGMCAHGTPLDDDVIRPFIGKGCSLREA